MSKLVSIIIPAYNAEKYIRKAVESAISQTYLNTEIIVVNDGSTDDTAEILRSYKAAQKIVYIEQENKGLSGARNTGIREAKGEYIAFLDADDIFLPKKIEQQVKQMEDHGACDVSYCDVYHFWNEKPDELYKLQYEYPSGGGPAMIEKLLTQFFIVPVSVVIKKDAFERFGYFDESLRRAEDLDFWLRLLHGGGRICHLPKALAKVRMLKEGNLQSMKSQPKVKGAEVRVLERFFEKLSTQEQKKLNAEDHLARFRKKLGIMHLATGNKKEARKHLPISWRITSYFLPAFLWRNILGYLYYKRRYSRLERVGGS